MVRLQISTVSAFPPPPTNKSIFRDIEWVQSFPHPLRHMGAKGKAKVKPFTAKAKSKGEGKAQEQGQYQGQGRWPRPAPGPAPRACFFKWRWRHRCPWMELHPARPAVRHICFTSCQVPVEGLGGTRPREAHSLMKHYDGVNQSQ